jgi:microcystin-dependent protein
MADPYIGQIILFGGNFAPLNWAFCDGSLLSIAEYSALFSLLGTTYGGDGVTTFALPDLRGRAPLHFGPTQGPGLSPYVQGQTGGSESVTLVTGNLPAHNHPVTVGVSANSASVGRASGAIYAGATLYDSAANASGALGGVSAANAGGSGAHNNVQPYIAMNYIIALEGIYPSRN